MNENGNGTSQEQRIPPGIDQDKLMQMAALVAAVVSVYDREMPVKMYDVIITNDKGREEPIQASIPQLMVDLIESNRDIVDAVQELTEAVQENTDASEPDEEFEPAPRRKRK